ncbi:YggT family protein [Isobaculum melis]|uniref:YggT family protein n=1 Tax=Isobaculum melis TaxID=142588 RepID=A0A1H9T777_9LACT|nr:YggT family protein [Isobaculum melis]SER92814.1 YggT family protein [Isobaculum melis]
MSLALQILLILLKAIEVYSWVLIVYVLISWFPQARGSKFEYYLGKISEPFLGFFRKLIPPFGGIDFSPIIAFFALNLIQRGLVAVFIRIF